MPPHGIAPPLTCLNIKKYCLILVLFLALARKQQIKVIRVPRAISLDSSPWGANISLPPAETFNEVYEP